MELTSVCFAFYFLHSLKVVSIYLIILKGSKGGKKTYIKKGCSVLPLKFLSQTLASEVSCILKVWD